MIVPFCPQCKERLKGNNSGVSPWRCSCGVWVYNMDHKTIMEMYTIYKQLTLPTNI